jgi:hypothetical protein
VAARQTQLLGPDPLTVIGRLDPGTQVCESCISHQIAQTVPTFPCLALLTSQLNPGPWFCAMGVCDSFLAFAWPTDVAAGGGKKSAPIYHARSWKKTKMTIDTLGGPFTTYMWVKGWWGNLFLSCSNLFGLLPPVFTIGGTRGVHSAAAVCAGCYIVGDIAANGAAHPRCWSCFQRW